MLCAFVVICFLVHCFVDWCLGFVFFCMCVCDWKTDLGNLLKKKGRKETFWKKRKKLLELWDLVFFQFSDLSAHG